MLAGRLRLNAELALRLARVWPDADAAYWLNIQNEMDLREARTAKAAALRRLKPMKPIDSLNTTATGSCMSAKVSDKPAVPVAILVRVSTDRKANSRQVNELRAVADAKGWAVVEVCKETITGKADASDRLGLKRIETLAAAGKIKKVLVHEISRLSCRPSVAHTFVEMLEGHGISLYWHAQSIETVMPNGKRNPAAAIMLAVLAEMARAQTESLSERIKSGLAEARRKGVKLGRREGSTLDPADFLARHKDVVKLMRDGQSIRHAAGITGKGVSTVQRVKAALDATPARR